MILRTAVLKDKEVFDNNLYLASSHAHNVYYTYLVSGGLLIFSIFVWFWFYIFWVIGKHVVLNNLRIYRNKFPENEWIVLSSISVVLVNLGIGWVNTTLHHEHAILSMFILGLLIAQFSKSELIEDEHEILSIFILGLLIAQFSKHVMKFKYKKSI